MENLTPGEQTPQISDAFTSLLQTDTSGHGGKGFIPNHRSESAHCLTPALCVAVISMLSPFHQTPVDCISYIYLVFWDVSQSVWCV